MTFPIDDTPKSGIAKTYGAYYFRGDEPQVYSGRPNDLYSYKAYHGEHTIEIEQGDSLIYVENQGNLAVWVAGPKTVQSKHCAILYRGYQCGSKTVSVDQNVNLPYVNGCATRQLFHPERIGDPTFQQLTMPPHTSEQVHHIHSTPRVVYVKSGRGFSIVGQGDKSETTELVAGMTCVLDPMCPHHFKTEDDYLIVLPAHIYSSTSSEHNHPMFNGTKEI